MNNQEMQLPEYIPTKLKQNDHKAKYLVVFMHGLGSDGNDLISLAPFFEDILKDAHFISPNAPEHYDMAPYGYQWFSLQDRDKDAIAKNCAAAAEAAAKIIIDMQKKLDLSNRETILIGFSQGGMMASYLTLSANEPYLGCICFSSRLVAPKNILNYSTQFCLIHGKADQVVPFDETILSAKLLDELNIKQKNLLINNLTHSICASGIEFACQYCQDLIEDNK